MADTKNTAHAAADESSVVADEAKAPFADAWPDDVATMDIEYRGQTWTLPEDPEDRDLRFLKAIRDSDYERAAVLFFGPVQGPLFMESNNTRRLYDGFFTLLNEQSGGNS